MRKLQIILIVVPIITLILFFSYLSTLPQTGAFEWSSGTNIDEKEIERTVHLGPVGWGVIALIVVVPTIIWFKSKKSLKN
ncbi:MAG: hypothetical protein J4F36_12715 [Nitrosopumilaceae archaeon]|nr:hypothetical protein [Nitrosopumilaceae archaeon]